MTREQLLRFVRTRNESEFNSNLQVWSDADACGFKVEELGEVEKLGEGHYRWRTPHGALIENPDGRWELIDPA